MAFLYDLAPALLRATRSVMAARGGDLSVEDLAGAAVLLGITAEIMPMRPIEDPDDVDAEVLRARECLDAAMQAVRRGRALR